PIGDESKNKIIKKVGTPKKFDFKPKDHIELGEALGVINIEAAGKISGARFGYFMGDLALMEIALVQFAFQKLAKKGFVPVIPPVMITPEVFVRMARLDPGQEEERYFMPKDNLYLVGSAEHTLGPLHMDQILDEKDLPKRYVGFSSCFRREAGSYGKDVKGMLRVHQFDKVEMECFTVAEEARNEQDFLVSIQEEIMQELNLPYQVIAICTGDMGGPDARQLDINTWMPAQNTYRETQTADLMGDYQARRLKTRVRRKSGEIELVHMNDATCLAIGRTMIAVLENYQNADGSVTIPDALRPYMGKDTILPK
ncbi:MAG: serine--tRNA ligase, partial [Patescibacteria group bacterium]